MILTWEYNFPGTSIALFTSVVPMQNEIYFDSHRRTVIKSLLWRFIGIFWTWGGAYVIILMLPEKQKNAVTIATLVTAWHHSTRMIMYYLYERAWTKISWGKINGNFPQLNLTAKQKLKWFTGTVTAIIIIFWLLFFITPSIKKNQKGLVNERLSLSELTTNKLRTWPIAPRRYTEV